LCVKGDCTGATPNDYGRCSSQSPTYDRNTICGWHANWLPASFVGKIACCGGKNPPLPRADDDFHIDLDPTDTPLSNIGRSALTTEFDSDETTDNFHSKWWDGFDDDEHVHALVGSEARIIGLLGIDTEHGEHGELHPVYVFAVHDPGYAVYHDTWGIFVRNWGNEGLCGGSQHYLDLTQFTLRFPAPKGAEQAISVVEDPDTNFDANSENGSNFSGFTRSRLSPLQHDANGNLFVEMTFTIGPPEDHTFIDGSLTLKWMCDPINVCQLPQPTETPRARPPAVSQYEDEDVFPGARLLTKNQVNQLQKQLPSRRPTSNAPSRTITIVPFVNPTPPLFRVGQGSLTDRTVPDPVRQARIVEVQKSICKTLANNPQRPAICNSLP
jgi:hypothetical protein